MWYYSPWPVPDPGTVSLGDSWREREQNSTIASPVLFPAGGHHSIQLAIERKTKKILFLLCQISQTLLGSCWIQACETLTRVHRNAPQVKLFHAGIGISGLFVIVPNVTNTVSFFSSFSEKSSTFLLRPIPCGLHLHCTLCWVFPPWDKGKVLLGNLRGVQEKELQNSDPCGFL